MKISKIANVLNMLLTERQMSSRVKNLLPSDESLKILATILSEVHANGHLLALKKTTK